MSSTERDKKRAREWYFKNRERALSRIKENAEKHKKEKREYDSAYRTLNAEKIKERLTLWYVENKTKQKLKARSWKRDNPLRTHFFRYQGRAKEKQIAFDLEYELFIHFVKLPCVYCGFDEGTVGLDRIDSSVGYTVDNVVPCCKVCNYMKLDHSVEDWFSAMRDILIEQGYEITRKTEGGSNV